MKRFISNRPDNGVPGIVHLCVLLTDPNKAAYLFQGLFEITLKRQKKKRLRIPLLQSNLIGSFEIVMLLCRSLEIFRKFVNSLSKNFFPSNLSVVTY